MLSSDDLQFFAVIAASTSLAESARKLNVTPPAVTQRLKALEDRIGVRLVDRSGRRLAITEEGALVAEQGRVVVDALDRLSEALGDRRNRVSGHLRIVAPHGFGRVHVAPVVARFIAAHRAVTVTLDLTDHPGAQLIDSCDLAIHIGVIEALARTVSTLAPNRRILCASSAYLDRSEAIGVPADLARHPCLVVRENDEDVTLWRFRRAGQAPVTVRVHPLMSSNDGTVVRDWALQGMGVAIRSEWDVAADLAAGLLRQVLPQWDVPAADVLAMPGPRHGRSARTTAFLALLRQSLNPPPWRGDSVVVSR